MGVPYFYPRPPRGGRPFRLAPPFSAENFYPRPPRGGRLLSWILFSAPMIFLSTPSARRATFESLAKNRLPLISIHALREEGDRPQIVRMPDMGKISIHALREEGDLQLCKRLQRHINFYPRPPRGGRPNALHVALGRHIFLSTPSARRATRKKPRFFTAALQISIHALREEGDQTFEVPEIINEISIHALREEGDKSWWQRSLWGQHFYPRPPRGGRRPRSRP